ncbi:MAG: hypothetical protein V2J20_00685 [Wenzhouxiangella sp.]|nr:hypothetical protein [Wenzhouxiangella sp.]
MTRAGPLDVLGFIGENLRYEDLLDASSEVWMNIGSLRVLGLEALIAEKKRMGRAKDNAAVELLEEVLRHRLQRD